MCVCSMAVKTNRSMSNIGEFAMMIEITERTHDWVSLEIRVVKAKEHCTYIMLILSMLCE